MATYYLISTINSREMGWEVFGVGTKKEMEELKENHPAFIDKTLLQRDIYAQTLRVNARVVSKTKAIREYKIDRENF